MTKVNLQLKKSKVKKMLFNFKKDKIKAKNVMSNKKVNLRIKGVLIGLFIFIVVEYFFIRNYILYLTLNNLNTGLTTFISSFIFFAKSFTCSINLNIFKEIFKIWVSLWKFNILFILFLLYTEYKKYNNYKDMEHGSSRWGVKEEQIELYKNDNSIPVADNIYISMGNPKIKNLNELCIGDTGAGKSFTKLIPDIMEMNANFIITDVKGSLYRQTYKILEERGYKKENIKLLNFNDLKYTNTFNPFAYLETEQDIDRLANTFVINSRRDGASVGDGFWEDTSSMLLSSVISYLHFTENETKTFFRVMDLINSLEIINGSISMGCEYARLISNLKEKDPYHSAVLNYELVTKAPQETLQSVIISLQAKLRLWVNEDLRIMTNSDEMELDKFAEKDEKIAIFISIPSGDTTYKIVTSMFISTALSRLSYLANTKCGGKLPNLTSFELDEFANIGILPNFDNAITTFRSQNIRALMIVQSLQQLTKNYDKADKTIISNCDTFNYLGTRDIETREQVVKMLGKTTIEEKSFSKNIGNKQGGGSETDRGMGRELLTLDELGRLQDKSIVFIGTYFPFYCDKFKTYNHKYFTILGNDDIESEKAKKYNIDVEQQFKQLYEKHKEEYNVYKQKNIEQQKQSSNNEDDNNFHENKFYNEKYEQAQANAKKERDIKKLEQQKIKEEMENSEKKIVNFFLEMESDVKRIEEFNVYFLNSSSRYSDLKENHS